MDPGANFAKTRLQRDSKYGVNPINDRSKSPLPKRKKILSDNPFDLWRVSNKFKEWSIYS